MEQINEAKRNSALYETHEDIPERKFFNHKDAINNGKGDSPLFHYLDDTIWLSQTIL